MNRRAFLSTSTAAAAGLLSPFAGGRPSALAQATPTVSNPHAGISVHTHSTGPDGFLVNAYLIETSNGVVVIDATLRVSDATALRGRVEEIGKPLLAVLLTHGHPDHYGGVGIMLDGASVPVISTAATNEIIRRDAEEENATVSVLLGDEWPTERVFPNTTLNNHESVAFDGIEFTVHDLGPGESHADGMWMVSGLPGAVFTGDVVYSRLHSFLQDGHTRQWIELLEAIKPMLAETVTLFPGHGGATTPEVVEWQIGYIAAVREAVAAAASGAGELTDTTRAAARDAVVGQYPGMRLTAFLDFSLDAVAAELAAES